MTREQIQKLAAYTERRVRDPQPGDHFTEHFGSVALIVSRNGGAVTGSKTKIVDREKIWTEPQETTVNEFIKWASDDGISGFWLDCFPPNLEEFFAANSPTKSTEKQS